MTSTILTLHVVLKAYDHVNLVKTHMSQPNNSENTNTQELFSHSYRVRTGGLE